MLLTVEWELEVEPIEVLVAINEEELN